MIDLSVIIPTFNREKFVVESVISVLNQSYKNFELIIIDDGSTDRTPEKIKEIIKIYRTFPIIYKHYDRNRGPAFARNRGAEIASGEYLAFLDSDDLWLKNKLKEQINFMRANNYSISQTEEIWIRNGKRVNQMKKHKKPSGNIFEESLKLCVVSPSSVIIKKDIFFELGGFDENFLACEDYDLWLRLSLKYPVYLLPKKLIIKRAGNWEHQSKKIPYLDRLRIESMLKILRSEIIDEANRKKLINELLNKTKIYLNGLLKREKYEEAKKYFEILETYGT